MNVDEPITFREPSYLVFDTVKHGVCTTEYGNLAIFSTRGMAELAIKDSVRSLVIIEVMISRVAK